MGDHQRGQDESQGQPAGAPDDGRAPDAKGSTATPSEPAGAQPSRPGSARLGPTDSLVDVEGLLVGHAHKFDEGWLSGTTVVLTGPDGAVAGVDVRGGGPGTRETDLLDPRAMVQRVHAVVLTGGSAYGLAAADGVMAWLEERGIGLPVGGGAVVPIVPSAVLFDLGRGGDVTCRPGPAIGRAAAAAASRDAVPQGCVGAGTGAVTGGLKGGVGSASQILDDGSTVAALVVVNAVGSAVDPDTGALWAARAMPRPEIHPDAVRRLNAARDAAQASWSAGQATTLMVIATDATLTKAGCAKLAALAHDGLARAVDPVHTMLDGDTAFALATCRRPEPDMAGLHALLTAAARCTSRAVAHAMLAATGVTTPGGTWPAYREVLAG